jgi:hypothetical protein
MMALELMMKEVSRKNAYLLLLKRKLFILSTKRSEDELTLINIDIESHEMIDKVNATISRIKRLKKDIETEIKCSILLSQK